MSEPCKRYAYDSGEDYVQCPLQSEIQSLTSERDALRKAAEPYAPKCHTCQGPGIFKNSHFTGRRCATCVPETPGMLWEFDPKAKALWDALKGSKS